MLPSEQNEYINQGLSLQCFYAEGQPLLFRLRIYVPEESDYIQVRQPAQLRSGFRAAGVKSFDVLEISICGKFITLIGNSQKLSFRTGYDISSIDMICNM